MTNQKFGMSANCGRFVAGYSLLYMFPISHLYYYNSEYSGNIPEFDIFEYVSFLGSAILLLPYFCGIVFQKKSWLKDPLTSLSVIVLFGSISGIIGYHMVALSSYPYYYEHFNKSNAIALISYLICFVTGYYIKWLIESSNFRYIIALFYIMMCVNALLHADLGQLQIYFPYDQPYSRNYQFFSDTFALFSLILIAMQRRNMIRLLTIYSSLGIIFLFGGRGGFYALMITIIFVFLSDQKKGSIGRGMVGSFFPSFLHRIPLVLLAVTFMLIVLSSSYLQQIPGLRIVGLVSAPLSDKSLLERIRVLEMGLERLKEIWVFGSYGEHLVYGDTYIHNFLSFWSNYGLIVFLSFLWLLIQSFVKYRQASLMRDDGILNRTYRYLLVFSTIMIILVRSHYYPYIFINFGLLFAILHEYNGYRKRL